MVNKEKLLKKLLSGSRNIRFNELRTIVEAFGFRLVRIQGSHHIFEHPNIHELINLQEYQGQAKPYQINQFLSLVEKHHLIMEIKPE